MPKPTLTKPAILLALALAASPVYAACPAGQTPMLHVRLYFGLTQNGLPITDAAWEDFLSRTVTPRFAAGYTVFAAVGRWRDQNTKISGRELSRVIEVDAPDTKELRDKAEEIRKTYAARFHQQSVGIVTLPVCGAF